MAWSPVSSRGPRRGLRVRIIRSGRRRGRRLSRLGCPGCRRSGRDRPGRSRRRPGLVCGRWCPAATRSGRGGGGCALRHPLRCNIFSFTMSAEPPAATSVPAKRFYAGGRFAATGSLVEWQRIRSPAQRVQDTSPGDICQIQSTDLAHRTAAEVDGAVGDFGVPALLHTWIGLPSAYSTVTWVALTGLVMLALPPKVQAESVAA